MTYMAVIVFLNSAPLLKSVQRSNPHLNTKQMANRQKEEEQKKTDLPHTSFNV
jgi:hypothetical protein